MILACPLRNDRTHVDLCFWGRLDLNGQNSPDLCLAFSCWIFTTKKLGFVSCCAKAKNWLNYSKVGTLISFCVIWSYYICTYINMLRSQYDLATFSPNECSSKYLKEDAPKGKQKVAKDHTNPQRETQHLHCLVSSLTTHHSTRP